MNGPMLARSKLATDDPYDEHYLYHPHRSHGRRKACDCRARDGSWWRRQMRRREGRAWRREQRGEDQP